MTRARTRLQRAAGRKVQPLSLRTPSKKEIAMQLISSAENSTLDWRKAYRYIEDINDGRGYTAGLIGFCSATGDMLKLIQYYATLSPTGKMAGYVDELQQIMAAPYANRVTLTHSLLDPNYVTDWQAAADNDALFRAAQDRERDRVYFNPAVDQGFADGLSVLGQFIYYDCLVMHGPGTDSLSFGGIRTNTMALAQPPSKGGDERAYLNAFLDTRKAAMASGGWKNTDRIDLEQRKFLNESNFNLAPPLSWSVYGDPYTIATEPVV